MFRIVADNSTVTNLAIDIQANCSLHFISSPAPVATTLPETTFDGPKPVQVIQYYRASSIALTLDGYNNSAVLADEGAPDTPLPGDVDANFMECLNETIGRAAPLIDGASLQWTPPTTGLIGLAYVVWCLSSWT